MEKSNVVALEKADTVAVLAEAANNTALDDKVLNQAALEATADDHELTIAEAIRVYPKAIGWALVSSTCVIMEGYDTNLLSNFFAYPSFLIKYGRFVGVTPQSPTGYQLTPAWQAGLSQGAGVGSIFGCLRKAGDNVPEAPKTPSPSDQDRPEHEHEHGTANEVAGLGKPADLPKSLDDIPPPVPDSANKDHLDVSKSHPKDASALEEEDEGIIQPFHSFVLSLTMILVSEVGDKTFLVAALMAMKHDRLVVFSAAFGALLVMTVLSAVLGHAVPTLIPKRLTSFAAAGLFFVFGAKLLREGMAMDPNEGVTEELHEVERELAEKEKESAAAGRRRGNSHAVSPYALEMGLGDGDHRKSRSKSRFPSPPRSPSSSRSRSRSGGRYASAASFFQGLGNLSSLLLSPAWVQTFVMTFLGEWGDRSQIATIAMAAGQDYWWVTLGAMTGHCVCTGVAVIGGRAIAGKVSLKVVTIGGALAFLLFGFIYFIEALYA
ncbi:hypothetical protein BN1723_004520 [Verticillium longisporum]|uniref:GDT1 family protein n=1 Tax=Verticillium longisporum TaxID=100787 RepID=A0A0G4MYG7_VERLO|nr:hypothetical protein BN1723_004520 [Verticillium longisporum]